jgi:hypothetical protein
MPDNDREAVVKIDADGIGARHDIIGILTFGADRKLSGERIYASDELTQLCSARSSIRRLRHDH